MANTMLDFESAPLPPTGMPMPRDEIAPATKKDEKEMLAPINGFQQEQVTVSAAGNLGFDDGEVEPTDEEYATLRKISAPMSIVSIGMCFIELCERASYYGCQYVFVNFVRAKLPEGGNGAGAVAPGDAGLNQTAGALGLGSVTASAIKSMFTFLAYVLPIAGGILADTKLGRFKTLCLGTFVGVVVHFLLVIPAIPSVISSGHAFPPFVIFVILLSFTSGLIKPCLGPLLCDQSPVKRPVIRMTKKGERVILDPQATIQRYLLIFYWCINVGAMFGLATTYSERLVGFWLAYLEPGILYAISPLVLWWASKRLYKAPPQGSVLIECVGVFKQCLRNGGWKNLFKRGHSFWDAAKPSLIEERDGSIDRSRIIWDDLFVDEIKQSVSACGVFFLIPIFILADGGIGAMEDTQSAAMRLDGVPNDVINNFNSLTILLFTPIFTWGIYPFLAKIGWPMTPTWRLFWGFQLGTINMIFGALIQWKIYQTSPCGYAASTCDDVAPVSLWWQITLQGIPAIGEILVNVTSYEIAYSRAPARMKGLVYAICLFSSAVAAAISLAAAPAIKDPNLIWPYVALAVACFVVAFIFPTYYRHLDKPMRNFADPDRQAGHYQPNYKSDLAMQEGAEGEEEKRY